MSRRKSRGRSAPQVKGYSEAGASQNRRALKGFKPNSGSPVEDINQNNGTLRQRSRMLFMASPVATAAINTNRTKVIGTGLTLKSAVDWETLGITPEAAKAWQQKAEAEFALWATKPQNCDAIGMNSFYSQQGLALASSMVSGDVIAVVKHLEPEPLNPYGLRLHLVEADRCSTPQDMRGGNFSLYGTTEGENPTTHNKIHDGVEVDANGRVVAYWICNAYPHQFTAEKQEWQRVAVRGAKTGLPNVLHMMMAERPDQYRGVPYLAPVIEPLLQLRRYTESQLMAALIQSFFTAWIQTSTNPAELPFNEVGPGDEVAGVPDQNPADISVSENQNEYEMGPGTVNVLQPGEEIKFGNPNIPTAGFDVFVKQICKLVGAGLNMPYEVLLKEFNSNYSASRAALLEAYEQFKILRNNFVSQFCQPVYELWLTEAVARGRIKAPGFFDDPLIRAAWCGARWIGPVQGSLDPKKEAEAALTLVSHGIKTHEQITRELGGGDWNDNVEQLRLENEALAAAGVNINAAPAANSNDEDDDENDESEDTNNA